MSERHARPEELRKYLSQMGVWKRQRPAQLGKEGGIRVPFDWQTIIQANLLTTRFLYPEFSRIKLLPFIATLNYGKVTQKSLGPVALEPVKEDGVWRDDRIPEARKAEIAGYRYTNKKPQLYSQDFVIPKEFLPFLVSPEKHQSLAFILILEISRILENEIGVIPQVGGLNYHDKGMTGISETKYGRPRIEKIVLNLSKAQPDEESTGGNSRRYLADRSSRRYIRYDK